MADGGDPREIFLTGERVVLRPLRPADADGPYPGWLNDPDATRYNSHHVFPYTRELALEYIERTRGSRGELVLAIQDRASGRHVGNVALQAIHATYRSAEFSILIGEADFRGRGIGVDAGRLLLAHGFDELNLHRVGCGTSEDNVGMQKLARQLGMREEGRRRGAMWKRGRFVDVVEYGVLRSEFLAPAQQP